MEFPETKSLIFRFIIIRNGFAKFFYKNRFFISIGVIFVSAKFIPINIKIYYYNNIRENKFDKIFINIILRKKIINIDAIDNILFPKLFLIINKLFISISILYFTL